jgi:hypothetical protein
MTPDAIAELCTRSDGRLLFARRGRPVAPVVLGAGDARRARVRRACGAAAAPACAPALPAAASDPVFAPRPSARSLPWAGQGAVPRAGQGAAP